MNESIDETKAQHKREIKSFEGDKLAAMKRAKSMGKKAKAAIKEVEFKYDALGRDLMERHRMEMDELTNNNADGDEIDHRENKQADDYTMASFTTNATQTIQVNNVIVEQQLTPEQIEIEENRRQKILQKKLKKKNAQREMEVNRERRINDETSLTGPSRKQMEMQALQTLYLHPRALEVQEVEADGNCLYRAVGVQCQRMGLEGITLKNSNNGGEYLHYTKIREICADVLLGSNRVEYEPFAEYGEGHGSDVGGGAGDHPTTFEEYVHNVRSTSVWGGQLELRALSEGLKRPIIVFSAEGPPLIMGAEYLAPTRVQDSGVSGSGNSDDDDWDVNSALLLSFHRHYYALGEHYNSVIPQLMK